MYIIYLYIYMYIYMYMLIILYMEDNLATSYSSHDLDQ